MFAASTSRATARLARLLPSDGKPLPIPKDAKPFDALGVTFEPVTLPNAFPKIFGVAELIAALALVMVLYSIADAIQVPPEGRAAAVGALDFLSIRIRRPGHVDCRGVVG